MKKILALCMVAVLCFVAAACGGKSEGTSASQGSTDVPTRTEGEAALDNPVSIQYEFEDENLESDTGDVYFYAGYTKPIVTIRGNDVASDKINLYFDNSEDEFASLIGDYAVDAREYYSTTQGMSNYLWQRDLAQGRADAGVISFFETEDTYLGGAHGSYYISGYTFDTATGELLKLENLSDDPAGFYQMLKKNIIEQKKVDNFCNFF